MDHWSILLAYSAYPVILVAPAPRIRFSLHKEFRDGEIRLYLHKEFRAAELGGDASENGDFQSEKQRLQGTNFSRSFHFIFSMKNRGDDATENVIFQRRKQRLQGVQNFSRVAKFSS